MSSNFISVGIVLHDYANQFLLQKRDQIDTIYFPGLWGLFGGSCESGETPENAARREIHEELELNLGNLELFLCLDIKSTELGHIPRTRFFYSAQISEQHKSEIKLNEGSEFKFFSPANLPPISEIVPFDLSAATLFYHSKIAHNRMRPI